MRQIILGYFFLMGFSCLGQPDRTPRSLYFKVLDVQKRLIHFSRGADKMISDAYTLQIFDNTNTNISQTVGSIVTTTDMSGATLKLDLDAENALYKIVIVHKRDTMSVVLKFTVPLAGVYEIESIPFRKGNFTIDVGRYVVKDPTRDIYKIDFNEWE